MRRLHTAGEHTFEIDEERTRLEFARIHDWLASSYWSPGIGRDRVERAARHSALVIGAYRAEVGRAETEAGLQMGYLRVVSDLTTFAYVCDVWVAEDCCGLGLGRAMVRFALDHPELQGLRRWLLATRDAHGVYQALGFTPLDPPDRWLMLLPSKTDLASDTPLRC